MNFRYCILTCVSSGQQAAQDRESLPHQLAVSREYGDSMGGTFITEYRADGYSRTGYWDLSQAFADAPPLGEMAKGVLRHEFDVIILESFDRLGDLGFMLFNFLRPHCIQLRSVQQPLPIADPARYDPKFDDSTPTMINNALNTNVYRIAKIQRAFEVGIQGRVKKGLYAQRLPYGYIRVDKDTVKLDERVAPLIARFPGWYLSGLSVNDIAAKANDSGVPSRMKMKWSVNVVKAMLSSPFYAGRVYAGRGYRDKVSGTYIYNKHYETYPGKQEAIWDWDTHLKIMAEMERRAGRFQTKRDYNLTGLLRCSVCGSTLLIAYDVRYRGNKYWKCMNRHVRIRTDLVDRLAGTQMEKQFSVDHPPFPDQQQEKDFTQRELTATRRRLARLEEAYEQGAYSPMEFAEKRKELKARESELLNDEQQRQNAQRRQKSRAESFQYFYELAPHLGIWIAEEKPALVKFQLAAAGISFVVTPEKTVTIELA